MLFSRGGFYRRKSSFSLESVVVSFVLAGMRSLLTELVLSSNPFALREHQSNARLLPVLGDLVDRKVLLMHEFTETLGRVERRSFCTSSRRMTTRAVLRGKNLSRPLLPFLSIIQMSGIANLRTTIIAKMEDITTEVSGITIVSARLRRK